MHRRTAVVFAVLAFVAFATACSNDKKTPADEATTTTTVPPSTTTSTFPLGPPQTQQAAADGLFHAWQQGDTPKARADASCCARPHAIDKIFTHPYAADTKYSEQGCAPQGGQFVCAWTYPGGALKMTVEAWPGGGFVVDDVVYTAD